MAQPVAIPYRSIVAGDIARPLLFLQVVGVNLRAGIVPGIVDSGADSSSFPFEYATLMGYSAQMLVPEQFGQVSGTDLAYRGAIPITAWVPEIPEVQIEIFPLFIPGSQSALWGRQDFMARFDVGFQERLQRFSIHPVQDASGAATEDD